MSNPVDYPEMNDLDEQLTAYLDGELSGPECKELEQRLINNESLRMRLAELRKSYELLDELPETPYDQRFTQSTIEHVIRDVRGGEAIVNVPLSKGEENKSWLQRNARYLAVLGSAIGAAILLAFVLRYLELNQERSVLGIASNLSGLMDVYELDVATKLSEEKLAVECLKEHLTDLFVPTPPTQFSDRSVWLDSMTPIQKAKMASELDSLRRLNKDSRTRYLGMQEAIEKKPDSVQIQDTVRVVGLLMDSLPNSDRILLNGMKESTRLQHLKSQMYFYAAKHYFSQKLTEHENDAIKAWGGEYLEPELLRSLPDYVIRASTEQIKLEDLINAYTFRTRREFSDTQILDTLSFLLPKLSDDGRLLLENLSLSQSQRLDILFYSLAPVRWGSDIQSMTSYEKLSPQRRESLDLADPSGVKRRILEESIRRRTRP